MSKGIPDPEGFRGSSVRSYTTPDEFDLAVEKACPHGVWRDPGLTNGEWVAIADAATADYAIGMGIEYLSPEALATILRDCECGGTGKGQLLPSPAVYPPRPAQYEPCPRCSSLRKLVGL